MMVVTTAPQTVLNYLFFRSLLVELVGIEKLGTLKTDKLLIRRKSYKAQKASNTCNAGFIVRLLYGDFSQSNYLFVTKSDRDEPFVIY